MDQVGADPIAGHELVVAKDLDVGRGDEAVVRDHVITREAELGVGAADLVGPGQGARDLSDGPQVGAFLGRERALVGQDMVDGRPVRHDVAHLQAVAPRSEAFGIFQQQVDARGRSLRRFLHALRHASQELVEAVHEVAVAQRLDPLEGVIVRREAREERRGQADEGVGRETVRRHPAELDGLVAEALEVGGGEQVDELRPAGLVVAPGELREGHVGREGDGAREGVDEDRRVEPQPRLVEKEIVVDADKLEREVHFLDRAGGCFIRADEKHPHVVLGEEVEPRLGPLVDRGAVVEHVAEREARGQRQVRVVPGLDEGQRVAVGEYFQVLEALAVDDEAKALEAGQRLLADEPDAPSAVVDSDDGGYLDVERPCPQQRDEGEGRVDEGEARAMVQVDGGDARLGLDLDHGRGGQGVEALVGDQHAGEIVEDVVLELFDLIVDLIRLVGEGREEEGEGRILVDALQALGLIASGPDGGGFLEEFLGPLARHEYFLSHGILCFYARRGASVPDVEAGVVAEGLVGLPDDPFDVDMDSFLVFEVSHGDGDLVEPLLIRFDGAPQLVGEGVDAPRRPGDFLAVKGAVLVVAVVRVVDDTLILVEDLESEVIEDEAEVRVGGRPVAGGGEQELDEGGDGLVEIFRLDEPPVFYTERKQQAHGGLD